MIKLKTASSTYFGDELKRLRKESGHTVRSLAAAIGYSMPQVVNWGCGDKRPPRAATLRAIAEACNVSPVSLYLAAAKDTGELSIDTTGLTVQEVRALLHQIAEETC